MRIERLRFVGALFAIALAIMMSAHSYAADALPSASRQLVLVVSADWDANQGRLYTFERDQRDWQPRASDLAVTIGRAGSAWGVGLHAPQPGVQKREGDGRSPAGVFAIGTAFGYADQERTGIPFRTMSELDYCIDVNDSPLYNRIVDARVVGSAAVAKSTEPMRHPCRRRSALQARLRHRAQPEERGYEGQLHLRAFVGPARADDCRLHGNERGSHA